MRGGFGIAEPCPADLDDDGDVGVNDLLILLGCWGPVGSGCEGADLNGDGDVGVADLLILLGSWGPCETCEPQALTAQEQDCLDTYEPGTPELKDCLEHVRDHGTFWEGGGDPEM